MRKLISKGTGKGSETLGDSKGEEVRKIARNIIIRTPQHPTPNKAHKELLYKEEKCVDLMLNACQSEKNESEEECSV